MKWREEFRVRIRIDMPSKSVNEGRLEGNFQRHGDGTVIQQAQARGARDGSRAGGGGREDWVDADLAT